MMRHKSLLIALVLHWGLMQLIALVTIWPEGTYFALQLKEGLVFFGTLSAIVSVWVYDYVLKDTRRHDGNKLDRRSKV